MDTAPGKTCAGFSDVLCSGTRKGEGIKMHNKLK